MSAPATVVIGDPDISDVVRRAQETVSATERREAGEDMTDADLAVIAAEIRDGIR